MTGLGDYADYISAAAAGKRGAAAPETRWRRADPEVDIYWRCRGQRRPHCQVPEIRHHTGEGVTTGLGHVFPAYCRTH